MPSIVDVSELRWAVKPDLLANEELLIEQSQLLGIDFSSQVLPQIKNVLKYDLKPITIFYDQLSRSFPLISYDMASVITWEMIKKSQITKPTALQLNKEKAIFQEQLDHRLTLNQLESIISLIEQNIRKIIQAPEYKKIQSKLHPSIRKDELNSLFKPICIDMLEKIKHINPDAHKILSDPNILQSWQQLLLNQYNYRQSSNCFNYKLDQRLRVLCNPFSIDKQPAIESLAFNIQEALTQQKYQLINAVETLSNLSKLTNTGSSLSHLGLSNQTGDDEYLLSINQPAKQKTDYRPRLNTQAPHKILKQLNHFKRCGLTLDFDLQKLITITNPGDHIDFNFKNISLADTNKIYKSPQKAEKTSDSHLLIQWKEYTNFKNFAQSCFPDCLPQLINKAYEIFPHHQGLKALVNLNNHFNQGILFIIRTYLQETIRHLPEDQLEQFLVTINNYLQDPAQSLSNKLETLCTEFGIQDHSEELISTLHKPNTWKAYLEQLPKKQKDKLKKQLPICKYHQTFEHLNTCYDELQALCDQDNQYQEIDSEIDYEVKAPLLQPNLSIQPDQNQTISTGLHIKCHIFELSEILAKQLSEEVYKNLLSSNAINQKLMAIFGAKEQLQHFIEQLIQKAIEDNKPICEPENIWLIKKQIEEDLKIAIPPHRHSTTDLQEDITEITEAILNSLRCSDTPLENLIHTDTPSYLGIILELKKQLKQFNAVNLTLNDPVRSLVPLLSIESLLTNSNNQALFRRNHHVWEKADQLIKTLRTVIISITIVPFIAACAIYIFKPKINGHRYKNFKSIWSGIKNMGFTNNTRRKDCVLSLNAFFDHFNTSNTQPAQQQQQNQYNLAAPINA